MDCFVFYLAERPSFYQYLEGQNLAVNTMDSYCWTADFFKSHFGRFGRKSLADYKSFLLENYKPKTVNLRIQGINKYLDFAGKSKLRIKNVKVQQKSFLENVISDADYKFLKTESIARWSDQVVFCGVVPVGDGRPRGRAGETQGRTCRVRIFRHLRKGWKVAAALHSGNIAKRSFALVGK